MIEISIADCHSVVDANSFDAPYAWPVYTTLGTVTMEVLLATIIWWVTTNRFEASYALLESVI